MSLAIAMLPKILRPVDGEEYNFIPEMDEYPPAWAENYYVDNTRFVEKKWTFSYTYKLGEIYLNSNPLINI